MRRFSMLLMNVLFIILCYNSHAQFKVSADIRPRGEIRYGYKQLPRDSSTAAKFISQRTRLNLQYEQPEYAMKLSFQDVRVWGEDNIYKTTGVYGNSASIDLYEAWFEYKLIKSLSVRVGRQEWEYDDSRLLSEKNWSQLGMTYDAVLLKYTVSGLQLHLGGSWNSDKEDLFDDSFDSDKMKTVNFFYVKNQFSNYFEASFIAVLTGFKERTDAPEINYFTTLGPFINGSTGNLFYEGSFYYQTGYNQADEKLRAYLIHSDVGINITPDLNALIGLDILSGTEAGSTVNRSFYPLYGARHKFYGHMDQFSNTIQATQNRGLQDYYLKVSYDFNDRSRLHAHYHLFNTDEEWMGRSRLLGREVDLMWDHQFQLPMKLRAGFSLMLPEKTLQDLQSFGFQRGDYGYFGYLMLSFSPELFSTAGNN